MFVREVEGRVRLRCVCLAAVLLLSALTVSSCVPAVGSHDFEPDRVGALSTSDIASQTMIVSNLSVLPCHTITEHIGRVVVQAEDIVAATAKLEAAAKGNGANAVIATEIAVSAFHAYQFKRSARLVAMSGDTVIIAPKPDGCS